MEELLGADYKSYSPELLEGVLQELAKNSNLDHNQYLKLIEEQKEKNTKSNTSTINKNYDMII